MTVLMVDKDKNFTAAIGDSVTLGCFIRSNFVAKYYWYKEIMGDFPRLVSSFYTFDESAKFYDEFKEENHLMIANLQHSDTGTYYCASSFSEKLEFKDGITIIIKGSGLNIPGHTNEDVLHYAALRTSMTDRPKRQMGAINEECVYRRVKHHR
uniref:Ig-like domain-containing protein n=1 Tax=Takifugu rubripes TaxID=31033 RepID=A0A674PDS2_TAKRU